MHPLNDPTDSDQYDLDRPLWWNKKLVQKKRRAAKGTVCPGCDKFCKEYNRPLNRTECHGLIWLVKIWEREKRWINVNREAPRWELAGSQLMTLKAWGLVEVLKNNDSRKKSSGLARPTQKGIDFTYRRIRIPFRHFEYKGEVLAFSAEEVFISEVIGDFHYQELMGASAEEIYREERFDPKKIEEQLKEEKKQQGHRRRKNEERTSNLGGGNHRSGQEHSRERNSEVSGHADVSRARQKQPVPRSILRRPATVRPGNADVSAQAQARHPEASLSGGGIRRGLSRVSVRPGPTR